MKKSIFRLFLLSFIFVSLSHYLTYKSYLEHFDNTILQSDLFRSHSLSENDITTLKNISSKDRGEWISYKYAKSHHHSSWKYYQKWCNAIWNDIKYFPVAQNTTSDKYYVTYENSWLTERSYGGKRGHEGCDLISSIDVPGIIPIVSATDGVVSSKGWLEQGGYRIGITSPSGGYFYYAHLDSYADIETGDSVKAGDIIGYMGNSGYGPEGTKGMFVTHLHFGIYIYPDDIEISINPYCVLRMIEEKKLFCSY